MVKPSLRSRIPGVLCIALSLAFSACEPEPADSNTSEKSDEDDDSKNDEDDKSEDKDDSKKSEDDTSEEGSESSEDESPEDDEDEDESSSENDEDDKDDSSTDDQEDDEGDESSSTDDEDDSTSEDDDESETDPNDDDSSSGDDDDSSTDDPDPCADISPSGSGKAKGDVPPDFELSDQNGDTFKLYDHCEEVVQLVGSAMWCGPCKQERGALQATYEKYKDQGFVTVTALFENNSSQPPSQSDLQAWTNYGSGTLTHPVIADPSSLLWKSSVFSGNMYVPVIALLGKNVQVAVPQQNQLVSSSAIEAELAK